MKELSSILEIVSFNSFNLDFSISIISKCLLSSVLIEVIPKFLSLNFLISSLVILFDITFTVKWPLMYFEEINVPI